MDKADAVIDRALIEGIGRKEAVDIVRAHVGDHFGGRHGSDLHVLVGINASFREVIAQQIIMHGEIKRNGEFEALPVFGVALVLVLHGERDRLAVDVLNGAERVGNRVRADTHGDGQRHRSQHVRGVVFLVERLVANDRPTGGLHHFNIKAVFLIKAKRVGHNNRRGASDGNKADLQRLLLERPALRKRFCRSANRQHAGNGGRSSGPTDGAQKGATLRIYREHRAHNSRRDDALITGLVRRSPGLHRVSLEGALMGRLRGMGPA